MRNEVVSREEWLSARLALLKEEKELTRLSDEVAQQRQELPWVQVDKAYRFDTDDGTASLKDLFGGRSQLLVYHFMFGPDYKAGCPSCSMIADGFNGFAVHLANHDVALWAVSRAPLAKLQAYKRRMGWTFPWASSFGDDFNFDFNVSITEDQQREGGVEYNYRRGDHPLTAAQVPEPRRPIRGDVRNRRANIHARSAGHERLRDRGRRRLPRLFHLCARTGRALGRLSVARPRAQGTQRERHLVAPPRRIRRRRSSPSRSASRRLAMHIPPIVSRQDWDAAREQLLVKEKAVMRARDALAAERRRMPWMAVDKAYEFIGPNGKASLLDLFEGRRQLIVYRAFFEPGVFGWPDHACRGCSLGADQVSHLAHLNARDTTLAYASRAPQADIARLKARMGWRMPWYTITDSFDADFGVDEWHGHNVFFRDGDRMFRTYFINNRGDEAMGTVWSYLDATPLGRQEVVGGFARGLSPDAALQMVELARQLRGRKVGRPAMGQGVGRRRSRVPKQGGGREAMSAISIGGGSRGAGDRPRRGRMARPRGRADLRDDGAPDRRSRRRRRSRSARRSTGSLMSGMVPMYLLMSAFHSGPG